MLTCSVYLLFYFRLKELQDMRSCVECVGASGGGGGWQRHHLGQDQRQEGKQGARHQELSRPLALQDGRGDSL